MLDWVCSLFIHLVAFCILIHSCTQIYLNYSIYLMDIFYLLIVFTFILYKIKKFSPHVLIYIFTGST
jgi:hypothetical protein